MPQDGGWIQLMEVPTQRVRARAHLKVEETTPGGWRGQLESLRLKSGATLAAGNYIALFGPWSEPHVVEVSSDDDGTPRLTLDGAPSVLTERADGQ